MQAALKHEHVPDGMILKGTLLVTSTLPIMAGAMIAPILPALQTTFADVEDVALLVQLILTLPALFIVIGSPIAGYIVDKAGRKPLLVGATVLYGLAGTSSYFAQSLGVLLIGRAIQGLAVAGVITSVTTLITDYYSGEARSQFLGYQAAIMNLSGTLFLVLGGVLAGINWHMPFLIYLSAFLILFFIIGVLYEPPHAPPVPSQDPVRVETERAPVRLMAFVYGATIFIQIAFFALPLQLPFFLRTLVNADAATSGFALAGMALFAALASSLLGTVNRRFGYLTVVIVALAIMGGGYMALGTASGWLLVWVGVCTFGFGFGLVQPNLNLWLADKTPAAIRGRALGGFATAVFLGQFLSPLVNQPIIERVSIGGFYALAGIALVVFGLLIFAVRTVRR